MNQRDIVKKMLYTAKSEFYANQIKDQAGNPKAIADIVNVPIATGVFPSAFGKALVTPLREPLKKTTLDANDVKNYRQVSNLYVVSKIVEKVVAVRFSKHLSDNDLYEQMQSAYRTNHSTETALLRVRSDERKAAILVLLDLSATFDTIDHTIMFTRLRDRFGILAICLAWFESYVVFEANVFKCTAEYPRNVQWCSAFRKVPFSARSCLFASLLHSEISHVDTG